MSTILKYTKNPIKNSPKNTATKPSIIPVNAIPFPFKFVELLILFRDTNPNIMANMPRTCATTGTKNNAVPTIPSTIDAVDNPDCLFSIINRFSIVFILSYLNFSRNIFKFYCLK